MRACLSLGVLIVVLLLPVQVFAGEQESVLCEETSALPARRRRPLPQPTVPYLEPRTTFPSGLLPGEPVVSETVQPRPLRRVQEGTCELVVRRHADGHYTLTEAGFELRIDPDGHLTVRDRITLDLTDLVMRAAGQDPYAALKEKALRATFPLRLARAGRHRREQLQLALGELPWRLEQVWADGARGPAAALRPLGRMPRGRCGRRQRRAGAGRHPRLREAPPAAGQPGVVPARRAGHAQRRPPVAGPVRAVSGRANNG